mmetsp:Transcript_22059/g.71022  ORF Transcript_22059/g.71022 Transcript_22059/m.71022 type:complete len:214 (-) Transcript_22059:508-1149(-)
MDPTKRDAPLRLPALDAEGLPPRGGERDVVLRRRPHQRSQSRLLRHDRRVRRHRRALRRRTLGQFFHGLRRDVRPRRPPDGAPGYLQDVALRRLGVGAFGHRAPRPHDGRHDPDAARRLETHRLGYRRPRRARRRRRPLPPPPRARRRLPPRLRRLTVPRYVNVVSVNVSQCHIVQLLRLKRRRRGDVVVRRRRRRRREALQARQVGRRDAPR